MSRRSGLSKPRKNCPPEDIIAILGMDELSEEDKLTVARARKAALTVAALFWIGFRHSGLGFGHSGLLWLRLCPKLGSCSGLRLHFKGAGKFQSLALEARGSHAKARSPELQNLPKPTN